MSALSTFLSFFAPKPPRRRKDSSNVLIISSGGLGDTVLFALIFPRFAKLAKDGELVTLLLPKDATKMAFLFNADVVIQGIDYNRLTKDRRYRKSTCRHLYDTHFRLLISTDFLRHPKRDELIIRACKAEEVLGMEPRSWLKYDPALQKNRELYDRLYDSGPVILDKVVRWARFADWVTEESKPPPQILLTPEIVAPIAYSSGPTVVFAPFSAVPKKQSPVSLFEAIANQIPVGYDITIVGAANDLSKNPDFEILLERSNVRFDDCRFEVLAAILVNAQLVVAVDTATMHLAVALGSQTLCLASAAYVGEIVPYAREILPNNAHFIYTPMDCQGCLGNCIHPLEGGMFPCVNRINHGEVIAKVHELLNERT